MSTYKLQCALVLLAMSTVVSAQDWEEMSGPPFYEHHTNGFGYNGKAYVIQGAPTGGSNTVWEYTPETDSWVDIADFPGQGRRIAIGDPWDDKYYFGFGSASSGQLNDLWVFDPVDTSFTQLPSCPCPGRTHPALIAHNDKIFMGTGSTSNGDLNDWWEYDMITQEWTSKPNVPGGVRHHPFFFGIGDYVYVGGGHRFNWLRFDPATDEWLTIDNTPAGRVAGSQLEYNDKGYLIAGDDVNHDHVPDFETFMRYDPVLEEWEYLPPLPNGSRWAPSSFIIGDDLYFFGGLSDVISGDNSMWRFNMTYLDCMPPDGLNAINIEETSAGLFWQSDPGTVDTLKWRKVGETVWNTVLEPQAVYQLTDLESCQDYEFLLVRNCDELQTSSERFTFSTSCCVSPELTVANTTISSAELEWPTLTGVDEYEVRWRIEGAIDWEVSTTSQNSLVLSGLLDCTPYECQIKSLCSDPDAPYGESIQFYTKNCGVCTDVEYCQVSQNFDGTDAFIQKVEINDYVNLTESDAGYGDFATPDTEEILLGGSFTLTLEPTVNDGPGLNWNVWIDFDGNGSFEEEEMVLDEPSSTGEITREIAIPGSATLGLTRMRVIYGSGAPNMPCDMSGNTEVGEAEDYCITIVNTTDVDDLENNYLNIKLYPNPVVDVVQLQGSADLSERYQVQLKDATGRQYFYLPEYQLNEPIDLSTIPAGVYLLVVENGSLAQTFKVMKQ